MFLNITATIMALVGMTAWQQASADATISLQDAVRQGKVKVEVKARGGATGATVRVEVQRQVPESISIEVSPGTVLLNSADAEQNVAVGQLKGELTTETRYRPSKVMVLADNRKRAFLLEAYCLDYAKDAPAKGGTLQLATLDKRVMRILSPPEGVEPTIAAVQIAIWMDRAGISADEAQRRFPGTTTEVDVAVARKLLAHAEQTGIESVPEDMSPSVKVHVTRLFSPVPETRTQAAAALGQMGAEALPAITFLADNVLDTSTDKPLPASVAQVTVGAALGTAAEALEQLGLAELSPLVDSLRQAGATVQEGGQSDVPVDHTVRAARGMVNDLMVDGLIARLKSNRAPARRRAAQVLGNLGNQRAVAPLIDLLEDEDEEVRDAAAKSLESLTNQQLGTDAEAWRQWLQSQQQAEQTPQQQ